MVCLSSRRSVVFTLKEDLVAYCKSDAALLEAGCQKFAQEFHTIAWFVPLEKCITIASACNRHWRQYYLVSRSVAVEPPRGWNGAQFNHSRVVLEWLLWNEHELPSSSSCAPRIQHVRNGGEQTLPATPFAYHVDSLDRTTHTIYGYITWMSEMLPRP